jgi:hypothetical protein
MWTTYDVNGRPTIFESGLHFSSNVITANTTYVTPVGCKALIIEAVGAGGAGGGANVATVANTSVSGGGGSGAYGRIYISTPNTSYAIVVGIGGIGAASVVGPNGSNTTVGGTVLVCTGGGGGNGAQQNAITAGLMAGGLGANLATTTAFALFLANGNPGHCGQRFTTNTLMIGGHGASSPLGSGGRGPVGVGTTAGGPASGYGAGGGGGISNTAATAAGGSGSNGAVIFYEFY